MAHRSRPLNHGELALWREVTKTINPLYGVSGQSQKDRLAKGAASSDLTPAVPDPDTQAKLSSAAAHNAPASQQKPVPHRQGVQNPPPSAPKLLPLAAIERPLLRKISRGQQVIDAVLDLHGMRQHEAHERLRRFLHQSQFNHARVVLVVTGKGSAPSKSHDPVLGERHGKGVLRRLVPDWLKMPDLRSVVLGFEEAAPHQGGSGALYVRLRRRRGEGRFGEGEDG